MIMDKEYVSETLDSKSRKGFIVNITPLLPL